MNVKRTNRIVSMMFDEMRHLTDEGRDLPVRWNVMHMFSSSQIAKILALRRGMDSELAALAAAIHDIAVMKTGKKADHARLAEPYVRSLIEEYNNGPWTKLPKVSEEETHMIIKAIVNHSDKEEYTDDPFVELLKDVDSLDRFLYDVKTEGAYLERTRKVLKELGIDVLL